MRFFQSCGALLLAVALLFVSTTSVKAQNPFEAAMSGVSFSKKDFADTIKDPCTYMQMEGKDKETPMKFRSPDGTEKQVTVKRTY